MISRLRHLCVILTAGTFLICLAFTQGHAEQPIGETLVVYSAPAVSALFEALVQPFAEHTRREFGTAVHVDIVTLPAPVAWAALETEWPAPSGDVYIFYEPNIREGIRKGYLQPIRPHFTDREWGRFDPEAVRAIDTGGYAAPLLLTSLILAVQDSLPENAVTRWADLSGKTLRKRFTIESALLVGAGYNVVAAAALVEGSDWRDWFRNGAFDEDAARPALERVRDWADNALTMTRGSGAIRPLLARREALASTWWWANTVQEIRNGMKLRIVYPEEGTITAFQAGPVVTSVTKNPAGATEWVKFVHSDFAAVIANRMNYLGRIPFTDEEPTPEWKDYLAKAKRVPIDEFRALVFDPAYNTAFINAYSRIVLEGQ
ncbi:extracellular solute-binding protein [Shinella sp.]|uniref:extracellular solute-binding protein n=1 Tax=Shinella sp. TaxID=1870904 RepID=UPI0029B96987|nr:extracellular solute-binding protein [Shinella sp.]MDX3975523.1 extracellular solute-binding protein [Shinella sp.]